MWKSLLSIFLALASLMMTGACTLSFASGVANMEEFASPQSEQPHPPQSRDDNGAQGQNDAGEKGQSADAGQGQPEEAPAPSQRSMRQQIRDAKRNSAPAAENNP